VPIPGEPCRSADELMRPSRIADDYTLNFSFAAPPMAEVEALALLDGFIAAIADDGGGGDDAKTLRLLIARARLQLLLAFGANDPVDDPADLAPISVNPVLRPALLNGIRQLWVTRLRPLVMARPCGTAAAANDDCVLLATLTVPVVNGGGGWEVKAGVAPDDILVDVDESRRPLLLAGNIVGRAAARAFAATSAAPLLAFMTNDGPVAADDAIILVRSAVEVTLKLAAANAATRGNQLILRNIGTAAARLGGGRGSRIGRATSYALAPRGMVTLRSDGDGSWRIIAEAEGRS
jgi:hypothetical protein